LDAGANLVERRVYALFDRCVTVHSLS
jgi:hypothetical protein